MQHDILAADAQILSRKCSKVNLRICGFFLIYLSMKNLKFLLLVLISLSFFSMSEKHEEKYQCMPCGLDCDKTVLNESGKCSKCHMDLVKSASIKFKSLSPSTICSYIKSHPKTILLDVRTKEEFEGSANPDYGTLKNAINIPIGELKKRLSELNAYKNKEIIVFCSHSHRSPQASYLLTQNGFNQVINMNGGMSLVKDEDCKK
jgi:rhodanese-related sulfurtransferase